MGYKIVFMWVLGHSGVPENEIAEYLATLSTSFNGLHPDDDINFKNVQTGINCSDIFRYSFHCSLRLWNCKYARDPNGWVYKTVFHQIT